MNSLLLWAQTSPYMGRIQGGWEFVWSAYFITFTALAVYGLRLAGQRQPHQRALFSGLGQLSLALGSWGVIWQAQANFPLLLLPLLPLALGLYFLTQHFRRVS